VDSFSLTTDDGPLDATLRKKVERTVLAASG
jgi:hypothetical protein